MLKIFFVISLTGLLFSSAVTAQDRLGLANSNYMPVTTLLNNPSSIVDSYTWLDINLIGASLSVSNNYLYMDGSKLSIADRFQFKFGFDHLPSENTSTLFNKNIFVDLTIPLPSAALVVGRHSGALAATMRTVVDLNGFPTAVARGLYQGFANLPEYFNQKIDASNIKINQLSWMEVGLTYGTFAYSFDEDVFTFGVSVKKLWGLSAFAAQVDKWSYTTLDKQKMQIDDFKATVASATGFGSGEGWSADLGVTYKKFYKWSNHYRPNDARTSCNRMPYRFKISAAIIDLGNIKFAKDAALLTYENGAGLWQNYSHSSASSVQDVTSFFDQMMSGGTVKSSKSNSFTMGLPTAITGGVDFNLGSGFYAGANTVIGIPSFFMLGPQRPFQLALVPRYERRFFEVSLPISTINFQDVRVGFMMRAGFITIGTDRLNTFWFGDVYSADFFLMVKMPFFTAPQCEDNSPKRKVAPFCPKFR